MVEAFCGIDPGLAGGLALLAAEGEVLDVVKMPPTERDVYDALKAWATGSRMHAALEFVRSSPGMGVASSFKFGQGYGGLRMALVAVGVPFDEVTPQRWQGALGCRTGGDKNVSKRRAQELFPAVKVTHAIADALLIAEYGRRLALGMVAAPRKSTLVHPQIF